MNANPRDVSTPYMDIVERTGSGVYDLELRSRLGDLSGLSSGYLYGNNEPGFGLYTENGFFKGAITADTGSIAGILHVATVQGGLETGEKISIGRDVSGTNDGIYVNNNNYWYTDGAWKVGGATNFISLDNFTDGNLIVRTETFTLDTPNMIISSSLNNGTMTLGANADTITETAEAGIYMDGNGKFRVGTGTTGDNYIYWDGTTLNIKGAIDITGGTGVNTDELNAATSSAITTANEFTNQSTASLSGSISDVTDGLDDKIFTDSTGRAVKAPTANTEGLYLASTNIGFYKDGEWKTYMDNEGDFFLTGSAGNKLAWDSSTGVLEIAGAINITGGNAATQDYVTGSIDTISGSLASSISSSNSELSGSISSSNATLGSQLNAVESLAEGKTSIFKQADAPATESRINGDMWIDSDDQNKVYIFDIGTETWVTTPDGTYDQTDLINQTSSSLSGSIALDIFTDATGKLVRTPDTSSAGLYLGDTNLGFYDDGEWKTYMANNGNFYLTGSESNYLFWDGTSLNIAGSINITSGNAATTSSVSDAQTAAQNFAATASADAVTSGSNAAEAALTSSIEYANQATASLSGSIAIDISTSNENVNQISASQALVNEGVTGFLDGKNSIFRQQTEPDADGRVDGDIWIDTDSDPANQVYVWATDEFVATPDGTYDQSGLISSTSGSIAADIFTDSTGKLIKTPTLSGAGLFLGDTNLGFYDNDEWKTYMANNGNFFLTGSDGGFLKWQNGALEIKGSINIVGGNAATQDFVTGSIDDVSGSLSSSINDSFIENSSSAADAQQTAVLASAEAALAEQTALTASALATTATERTVDADGKITFNPTPSGAGLFMSADNLGYYDTDKWKAYLSSSGEFFLSGSGNNGLSWDGSDLSIDGTIVARDGSIGGITLDSDKMYSGTGTFGNSNTPFFTSESGEFSLGDSLTWDGTTLTVSGDITVTNANDFASQAELDAATGSLQNSIDGINSSTSSLVNPSSYAFGGDGFSLGNVPSPSAGLHLGADKLGYHDGTSWLTYMDNSGHFLLSGSGDDSLSWNGATLRIGSPGVGPSLAYQFSGSLDTNVFDLDIDNTTTSNFSTGLGVTFRNNADAWDNGFHSKALFDRNDGIIFEWDVTAQSSSQYPASIIGLYRENPSAFDKDEIRYGVYFQGYSIYIRENGSSISQLASNDWSSSVSRSYRIRIQPLPTGAKYEIFRDGDFTTPYLTHHSTANATERYLRPGAVFYSTSYESVIFHGMAGGASLGQATRISGNTIQTGILESSNLSTTTGSLFNLNDGTFKLGGTSTPKLNWNGSTLSVVGNITVTNPDSFATPAQKNKDEFKIILVATGSVGSTNTDSVAYLASQGYTGGNGSTHFYDNNNDSDGNTNPANIAGYDTEDYDLYVFDCRNWSINGSEIQLALDLFDNGKSVLIAGNDNTQGNYTGSYNTEWPIKATTGRSGGGWMVGPSASGNGIPASHPILAGVTGFMSSNSSSDGGQLITQLKAFPKGGTVVQPFSITEDTEQITTSNDIFIAAGSGQGITSFIASNPRGGRMVNLNLFSLNTTGTYGALSAPAAKNLTSFLLRTDPAIEAHYMQVTSITGEMVTTGKINSSNLNEGSGTYTTAGTLFDLDNGSIKSKNFAIESDGDAHFRGDIAIGQNNTIFKANSSGIQLGHATFNSAPFRVTQAGVLTATSGNIGVLTMGTNKMYIGTGVMQHDNTPFYVDSQGNFSLGNELLYEDGSLTIEGDATFAGEIRVGGQNLDSVIAQTSANQNSLFPNPDFGEIDPIYTYRPFGVFAAYNNNDRTSLSYSGSNAEAGVLQLFSSTDSSIGMAFSAFPVVPGETYKFYLRIAHSDVDADGMYIRVYEANSTLSSTEFYVTIPNSDRETGGKDTDRLAAINNRTINGVAVGTLENIAFHTDYKIYQFTYTAHANAKVASLNILNWTGAGTKKLYVSRMSVIPVSQDVYTGTIGGWTMDSTGIFAGPKDSNGFADAGGITLSAGGSIHAKQFYIDTTGNAFFKGNISGSSGEFSGIVQGGTVSGSSVIGGTISGGTIIGSTINVPDSTDPHFSVDQFGNMSAQDADITGSLNIERGRLGSWIIQDVEEGGQLRDITGQVRLDSEGKEIAVYSGSEAGGYTKRVRIKAEDTLTSAGASNIYVSGIPNGSSSNLFTVPTAITSPSSNLNYNTRTQPQNTTTNTYTISEAGTYSVTGLYTPVNLRVTPPSGTISATASYPNWSFGGGIGSSMTNYPYAIAKIHQLAIYLEAVNQEDTSITSRTEISKVEARSATSTQYYQWNFTSNSWEYGTYTTAASDTSYTSGFDSVGERELTFAQSGTYKFRYVVELTARSGYRYNRDSSGNQTSTTYYTTTSSVLSNSNSNISYLSSSTSIVIPQNIIEITGGGIQVLQDSNAYLRMPRFNNYSQTTIPELLTMRGGQMRIYVGGNTESSDTTFTNLGKTYSYGIQLGGTDGTYPNYYDFAGGLTLPSMNRNGNIRTTIVLKGDLDPCRISTTSTTSNTNRDIASTNYYWDDIYADDFRQQSDVRAKENIANSNLGLTFINSLRPVQYNMKESTKKRSRYGFIAQEVSSSLSDLGLTTQNFKGLATGSSEVKRLERDYEKPITEIISSGSYFDSEDTGSGVVTQEWYDDIQENTMWNLNYLEFIAPLTKAVQELSAKVTQLEAQISGSI